MTKFLRFDWTLRIRIFDSLIILLLLQPIYVIWMYKIARLGEIQLQRKSNKIFLITSILFIIFLVVAFLLISGDFENSEIISSIKSMGRQYENIFVGLIIICWVYCSYFTMTMTFKLEESLNEDYIPTILDKIFRFSQILFWMFGIWVVQPKINELEERINNVLRP
jgi:uncharacterized membrane protein